MNDQENVKVILETAASNPKIAGAVATVGGLLGYTSIASFTQTFLGILSLSISCVIGLYVIKINRTKDKIYERMLKDGESFKE